MYNATNGIAQILSFFNQIWQFIFIELNRVNIGLGITLWDFIVAIIILEIFIGILMSRPMTLAKTIREKANKKGKK